jgi:hypothetical protein
MGELGVKNNPMRGEPQLAQPVRKSLVAISSISSSGRNYLTVSPVDYSNPLFSHSITNTSTSLLRDHGGDNFGPDSVKGQGLPDRNKQSSTAPTKTNMVVLRPRLTPSVAMAGRVSGVKAFTRAAGRRHLQLLVLAHGPVAPAAGEKQGKPGP